MGKGDGGAARVDVLGAGEDARTGVAFRGGASHRFSLAAMDMLLLFLCIGPLTAASRNESN
eukprot:6244759-Pyramimonas_sp.AAC.1